MPVAEHDVKLISKSKTRREQNSLTMNETKNETKNETMNEFNLQLEFGDLRTQLAETRFNESASVVYKKDEDIVKAVFPDERVVESEFITISVSTFSTGRKICARYNVRASLDHDFVDIISRIVDETWEDEVVNIVDLTNLPVKMPRSFTEWSIARVNSKPLSYKNDEDWSSVIDFYNKSSENDIVRGMMNRRRAPNVKAVVFRDIHAKVDSLVIGSERERVLESVIVGNFKNYLSERDFMIIIG